MRQKTKQNCKKVYKAFDVNSIAILILMGGLLNVYAIAANDGRMPVYADINYSDSEYFSTTNKSKIDSFPLVDRFYLPGVYFSIGDVIIYIGFICFCIKYITGLISVDWKHILKGGKKNGEKSNGRGRRRG